MWLQSETFQSLHSNIKGLLSHHVKCITQISILTAVTVTSNLQKNFPSYFQIRVYQTASSYESYVLEFFLFHKNSLSFFKNIL